MNISLRLKTVASQVEKCNTLADIGTDHAFVPIYLCGRKIIKNAIACDINKEPLERAKANISIHMMKDIIQVRQGNGLLPIKPFEAECAIISGMGGMLILSILCEGAEIVQSLKQMVLQPQHDIPAVRRFLHEIEWKIVNEEMVFDYGKYYTIISAKKGKDLNYSERDYIFGKLLIENRSPVLKDYIVERMEKKKNIMMSIQDSKKIKSSERFEQLKKEYCIEQEVYKCL